MITKFIGKAPIDTLWVSDSWLPEWAEAGWIAPVDQYKDLLTYNSDVDQFCVDSMTYKGKQYGITYYSDYMAFIYNAEMLEKAGIKTPPQTWAEVASQAKTHQVQGPGEWPVLIGMAQESWLIEFMTAMVVLEWRPFHRRQGQRGDAGPGGRRRSRRCTGWSMPCRSTRSCRRPASRPVNWRCSRAFSVGRARVRD